MNGQFDLITLISLIVAVVAIVKLRSVLGHKTDEDDARVERLKTRQREQAAAAPEGSADVITLPRRNTDGADVSPVSEPDTASAETRVRAYPAADQDVTEGLLAIVRADPAFDPDAFLRGAGTAYEMIISAFADGDRKALRDLLSREVNDGFVAAIADREARGDTVDQQFVGIKRSEIVEAELKANVASITVRFVSELITTTRNRADEIIAGDPQKIKDVTDIWTFSRDLSNARALSNPNWRLVATQAPN